MNANNTYLNLDNWAITLYTRRPLEAVPHIGDTMEFDTRSWTVLRATLLAGGVYDLVLGDVFKYPEALTTH